MSLPEHWGGLLGGITAIHEIQQAEGCSYEEAKQRWQEMVKEDAAERAAETGARYFTQGNIIHGVSFRSDKPDPEAA